MGVNNSNVKDVAAEAKRKFDGVWDTVKKNPETVALVALASVTVLHEIGYFIRSVKM